ncbi:hypothetical protein ABC347_04710 [Sphingomonas sp. 1P06PA]|uniref:hypothetical protein n=1 Tax=Sphingomonas sp. 1P06PA TaxID=554121 RepID=UPI0039A605C6
MMIASLMLLAAAQPAGTAASPPDTPTIVVSGKRTDPETRRKEAQAFVRETGVAQGDRPIARWIDPICPRAIGVPKPIADRVTARIEAAARAAKVPVARPGCGANITVSFIKDAAGVAQTVFRKKSRRFAEVSASDRTALMTGDAPVRWWYQTILRGRDGQIGGDPPVWSGGDASEGGGSALPSNIPSNLSYSASMIRTPTVRAMSTATVLIDVDLATGVPLNSVADYAAMVALAEIRSADASPAGSILALFEAGDGRPNALSEADRRFLRALYRVPLDRTALTQRGGLITEMAKLED